MTRYRLLIAIAWLAATSSAAAQRVDPAAPEVEGTAVGEQVRRDLGSLFPPGGSINDNAPGPARAQGHLRTRAYATTIPGVCRRDEVIVSYAGPGEYASGAAPNAVRPFGVEAQAWFKVVHDFDQAQASNSGINFPAECAALSNTETRGWFTTAQDYEAREAYRTYLAAVRQVREPVHHIIGCRENLENRQTCQRIIQGPEQIVRVLRCAAPERRSCLQFMLDPANEEVTVTIRSHQNSRAERRVDAVAIDLSDYETGADYPGDYDEDLAKLQKRLAHLSVANHIYGRNAIIVCEGWDAAGKGGAIQRLTAEMDPRNVEVWPIAAPTPEEKAHHYLWRFWKRLPGAGEIAIFDRSWYGRVLVERIEGFCTEAEWRRAYDEINEFEAQLATNGALIVKLFVHVTPEEQDKRFRARLEHPWKRWKINAEDIRNRAKRPDYLKAYHDMFAHTDTHWAPWTVIDGNDKQSARIAALSRVADALAGMLPKDPPPPGPDQEAMRKALGKD